MTPVVPSRVVEFPPARGGVAAAGSLVSGATRWPVAGEVRVRPGSSERVATGAGKLFRAGDGPVLLGGSVLGGSGGRGGAVVRVLPDRVVAGYSGVFFTVDGSAAGAVGVDYSAFADAVGADFGSRLHLVALPRCVLTDPAGAGCGRAADLGSVNDGARQVVTGVLSPEVLATMTSGPDGGSGSGSGGPSGVGGVVVFGAVADTAGGKGDFTASSLAPSGSWSTSGGTGAFSWSYPVVLPPAGTGTTPSVVLGYNSQSVDGRVASTNNQSSWLGQGWDYQPGFIERTYRTCVDVAGVPAAARTGDMCWAGQIVTMSLGGSTSELVQDSDTGVWHPRSDNGEKVEHLTGAPNGARAGEFWKVTTTDGTQYFFGKHVAPGGNAGLATNSVYTVPVYGALPGDECYSPDGFAASVCVQAWRWNLDYVQDVHGNAVVNYYTPEKNSYGANKGATPVGYVRGGYLNRIEYGLHLAGGSVYGSPAPQRVLFTVAERCTPTQQVGCTSAEFTAANAAKWPDTPHDLVCPTSGVCAVHSPTFFSTKRLTYIKTGYYNPTTKAYVKVDEYRLAQHFDGAANLGGQMLLDSIVHAGYAPDGSAITLPPVDFHYTGLANRVQGLNNEPAMPFERLTQIVAETGARTTVSYGQPPRTDGGATTACKVGSVPADQAANGMLCFPVRWTLPFTQSPVLDYFHKYVVTSVAAEDPVNLVTKQVTAYRYVGAPAWHADDNEVMAAADRTFGQWRGYAQVEVRTGDTGHLSNGVHDGLTLSRTSYLRGMGAAVSNSLGEQVPDPEEMAGNVFEKASYNGAARVGTELTRYTTVATTGTRPRAGLPDLSSTIIRTARVETITDLITGGTRHGVTTNSFDTRGRLIAESSTGTDVDPVCTTYRQAENTSLWVRDLVAERIVSAQACDTPVDHPAPVVGLTRTYFDGSTVLGQVTGQGQPTQTQVATTPVGNSYHFARTSTGYDDYGRTTSTTAYTGTDDQTGRTTTLAYTPAGTGATTQVVTTNPAGQKSTSKLTAGRGATWSSTDVGGSLTEAVYDQLGRLTQVYQPGQSRLDGDPATKTYSYLVRDNRTTNGPSVVTSKTLVDIGTSHSYTATTSLVSTFGAVLQTQTDAEDQKDVDSQSTGKNRVVSDNVYDSHGWVVATNNSWYTSGAPATGLITTSPASINNRTLYSYDLTGRQTTARSMRGLQEISATSTAYGGDRATTVPETGGVITTQITDVRGNITQTRQYQTPPQITGNTVTGGTYQHTAYQYDLFSKLTTMTDPAGATWSYSYDLAGRRTAQDDPDAGHTTTDYNDTGEATTATDARGISLTYTYDALGRKTAQKNGTTVLATWTYDTLRKGYPTSSTRHIGGNNYTLGVTGYDDQGNPTGRKVTIPAVEGALAGTYTSKTTYTSTGLVDIEEPPAAFDLPDEALHHAYTRLGRPTGTSGDLAYAIDTIYTPFGEVNQIALGVNDHRGWLTINRFDHSRRVSDTALDVAAATARVESMSYGYDDYGNITRTVDTQGGTDQAPIQTTCFTYNNLDQLTQAWSSSNTCASTPTPSNYATVQGPQPFWTTWEYDPAGNRTTQTNQPTAGKPGATLTTYQYNSNTHQHALTGATVTDPANNQTNSTYTYDDNGALKTRTQPGKNLALTYTDDGRTNTITSPSGDTSYIYDADGNILLRKDPAGVATLFNGSDQYRYQSGKVTASRFYTHAGYTIWERVGLYGKMLFTDRNGTPLASITITANGFTNLTRRHFDPYGNPLGTGVGTWPDHNRYLNQPGNVPSLVDMGARLYDPNLGRFLTVDPILAPFNPGQNNGYNYGWNNPLTHSDPGGTSPLGSCDGSAVACGQRANAIQYDRITPRERSGWNFAGDPNHFSDMYSDTAAKVVSKSFNPGSGSGLFKFDAFINSDGVGSPGLGTNRGDGSTRGFDPNEDPSSNRISIWIDMDMGEAMIRQNPSCTLSGRCNTGDPIFNVKRAGKDSQYIEFDYETYDSAPDALGDLAHLTGTSLSGSIIIDPSRAGKDQFTAAIVKDFPSYEAYYYHGAMGPEKVLTKSQNDSPMGLLDTYCWGISESLEGVQGASFC
ncbi:RHS repeat protein [Nakamurella silvestris]|nr:RHS repeat protein [Nakamurella silvestris]